VNPSNTVSAPTKTKPVRPPFAPKTVGEALYWSYANLAMAYASKRHGKAKYQQTDFIVRNKPSLGLMPGTRPVGSFFMDEKSKLGSQWCGYCKTEPFTSLDHLVPQFSGGGHSADNLVPACKSCNSSKGKRDFLDWMVVREQFPPLHALRRYLKLAVRYCVEHELMSVPLGEVGEINPAVPFSISALPYDYPSPGVIYGRTDEAQPSEAPEDA
jgi:hypothetical protein